MSSSASVIQTIKVKSPWMFGKEHDLFFFFISISFGYLALALTQSPIMSTSLLLAALVPTALGAGPFHQGPTLFMFWDAKNRANYLSTPKRAFIFFIAPPLLFCLTVIGMVSPAKPFVLLIWMIWSLQHLVQQNVGILLLFHRAKDNEAVVPRQLETLSQQIPAVTFTLLYIRRLMLGGAPSVLYAIADVLIACFAVWSAVLVVTYILNLKKQAQTEGKWVNGPALMFWSASVCSLWTLGFLGNDFSQAFLPPVTWHWFQYIGLNWRLTRNKYATEAVNNLPTPHPLALFFATCITLLAVNTTISAYSQVPAQTEFVKNLCMGVLFGFSHVHYFLDAFIWRFRETYPRTSILPYLIAPQAPQSTTFPATLKPESS